jgi:hypothetical protein
MNKKDKIILFFHCNNCVHDCPEGQSPKEWARCQAGWTKEGIMVECTRCEMKIIHIDLMGHKVDLI